jgi:hypothetical protein
VPVQVAVGQRAQVAKFTETQPVDMRYERRENAEARLLMQREGK